MDGLIERKWSGFSKGFQRVANYLSRDPHLFALNSAREVGRQVGVSETTVIRFANELGFDGYRSFQGEVQRRVYKKSSMSGLVDSKSIDDEAEQPIKWLMSKHLDVTRQTVSEVEESVLREIVDRLIQADRVVTAGMFSSYAYASWFAFSLDLIRGNAQMYEAGMDNPLLAIGELTEDSVFVVFSFHRYVQHTVEMARLAYERGVTVVAFTDSPIAPVADYAQIVLPVQLPVKSTMDNAPTVFMILSGIISMMTLEDEERFKERTAHFDSIEPQDLFSQSFAKREGEEE